MKKLEIYSIYNHNPEFIRLQYKSIVQHVLDRDYEFIVINNARHPGLRQQLDSIRKGEIGFIGNVIKFVQTKQRSARIKKICDQLGLRSIKVKQDKSHGAKSRFPSRIVAYSLNWMFKNIISSGKRNVICLLDSDMFFISNVSIESLLEGHKLGIVPQYRGQTVRYLWTGFAIFDLTKLPHPEKLDFSLGLVEGERCDVGGNTHYYLEEFNPSIIEYEFINIVDFQTNEVGIHVETYISGNVGLNLQLDHELSIIKMEIHGDFGQVKKILGGGDYEIQRNYGQSILEAIEYCKDLMVNPKNIDLIRKKHDKDEGFFVLHYKNGSNPRKFEDEQYSRVKFRWCLTKINGIKESDTQ